MSALEPQTAVAVRDDRARVRAILASPEAKMKPNATIALALSTDMSVREARKALGVTVTDRPMRSGRPHVAPDFLNRSDDTSELVAVVAPSAPARTPQTNAAAGDRDSAESILAFGRAVGIPGLKAIDEKPSVDPAEAGGIAATIALAKSVGLRGFGKESNQ